MGHISMMNQQSGGRAGQQCNIVYSMLIYVCVPVPGCTGQAETALSTGHFSTGPMCALQGCLVWSYTDVLSVCYCHVTKMASCGRELCYPAICLGQMLGQLFILLKCLWSVLIVHAPNALHELEVIIVHFANCKEQREKEREDISPVQ